MKLNVVVIGSGGREDALCWKLAQSPLLNKLFALPGNPGTMRFAENIDLNITDFNEITNFCIKNKIDLVVVGPEVPLVNGLADHLLNLRIKVFGPTKSAAEIEGSKVFAKYLMKKYDIPTASYETFNWNQGNEVIQYLQTVSYPTVIKVDGLAAGKGVTICNDYDSACKLIDQVFLGKLFGEAGNKIVIEEFLTGEEVSIFVLTDGEKYILLNPAQDYKKVYDGDRGKNTGGMGSYSFSSILDENKINEIKKSIVEPTLIGLKSEGRKYSGCLYCGLIETEDSFKVIEFNCRFGDPETQVVLQTLESDLLQIMYEIAFGELKSFDIVNRGAAICLVLASDGYPDAFEKGFEIFDLDEVEKFPNVRIFHAGTTIHGNKLITNGGRVLSITAYSMDKNYSELIEIVYKAADKVHFKNKYFRTDIGIRGISKFKFNQ